MRDNLVLEEKNMTPINIPDFDPSEYTAGQILDRIKARYKVFLKEDIVNLSYISIDVLNKIIGVHSFIDSTQWFRGNSNVLAKRIDKLLDYSGDFDEEVILCMCMGYNKIKGISSLKRDVDLDRVFDLAKSFLNKEFMNDKFFAHTIKDETELYLVSCASVIALEYVESVTDRGLSQTSMHDMYNTIKKEFGLNDRNAFVLMYNAGFHSSAVQTFIPADKGFYNKSYEFSSVFSAKNPIVEEKEFYNFKKTPKLWDKAEPITRQFFNENPRVPMYEIIKKYYSKQWR